MRLELRGRHDPLWRLWPAWGALAARMLRETALWVVLGIGFVALVLAYQSPRPLFVDIGGPFDGPHTPGFYEPEQSGQASFRWSAAHSALYFPGVGRTFSPLPVRLQLSSGRGQGTDPITVQVSVNGHPAPPLTLGPTSELYTVTLDPAWVAPEDGDVTVAFDSPTFRSGADKRDLGFIADFARLDLPGGLILPPLPQVGWLLLGAALLYLLVRASWFRPLIAGWTSGLFLLVTAGVIAVQRLFITIFTGQVVVTLLLALIVALLVEPFTRWLVRLGGWRGANSLPEWSWAGLRGLLVFAVIIRIGGLLYPHTNVVDAYFHLKQITYMYEGRPWEQFFGKALSLSVMPKEEWGQARAFIPYSPFFYVIAAPLLNLPWPKEVTVPAFAGLLDALKIPMIFVMGLVLGTARGAARRAFVAAAVFSFVPANLLLLQWGNWPTQISLWFAAAWAAFTCLFWRRAAHPAVWLISTALLTLTFISYTVMAVYMGIFLVLLLVAGWLFAPRDRKQWLATGLSLVGAVIAAIVLFFGQYIPTIINETLPTFGQAVESQGALTTLRPTLGAFLTGTLGRSMQAYNLALPYALGLAGALFYFLRGRTTSPVRSSRAVGLVARLNPARLATVRWQTVLLGAWLALVPLVAVVDFYVDQVLKEFWWGLPAVAVVGAVWLLSLWGRGRGSRAISVFLWLIWAVLAWQSVTLWVFRLLLHNR